MNWHKIPEFETVSSAADDNPFAGARVHPTGKVSVKLPVNDWLCRKMSNLNLTITEGYPTRNTDNTGLLRDQFIKPPRSSRWYGMHADRSSPKLKFLQTPNFDRRVHKSNTSLIHSVTMPLSSGTLSPFMLETAPLFHLLGSTSKPTSSALVSQLSFLPSRPHP